MKFFFALMVFFLPMTSFTTTPETTTVENKTEMVNVEVEFADGLVETFSFSTNDKCEIENLNTLNNVVSCTYQTPGGTCSCTASTCSVAWSCFVSACLNGRDPKE